jgi:hypothetical protein
MLNYSMSRIQYNPWCPAHIPCCPVESQA